MEKIIDFQKTVYEICTEDAFVMEVMKELGFDQITKPGMLQTAGRVMTIAKGARMKGIELSDIVKTFEKHGYTVKQ
ncbi:DUF1858 domain-containing protein [Niallia endozanthoxylica]|uniref:DUF1858 domain-containing protein n=1 Tax=Niallia endozanthoxylica TaxID=2036016 RepID=A0A5J5HBW1_9BACI|nr:DUF1858 domain-containing protein [Niallia endozanthoxylica]KAA9017042.1 DUF1858 domain-containing protein [Niallia endozanthoxylica]